MNLFLFSRVNVYVFLFGYESDKRIGHIESWHGTETKHGKLAGQCMEVL